MAASPDTAHLCVGLRFLGRDTLQLRDLARRAAQKDLNIAAGLFDQAAEATSNDEPMLLFCKDLEEARAIQADFTRWGITAPVLEEVRG